MIYVLDVEIPVLIIITNYHKILFYEFLMQTITFEDLCNAFGICDVPIFSY
jgi:hypothetical protein